MIGTRLSTWSAAFALVGVCITASPGLTQSLNVRGSPSAKVVSVNRCDPQLNAPAAGYVGFAPGRYPYAWGDVYGYRYYQPPLAPQNGTLYLDYKNVTKQVMSTIEFGLVANGRLVAEVRDVGTFSPEAEIKHSFGLSPNVFPLQTGLPQCVPMRITFANGAKWKNPHLPALQRSIYAPVPSQ
jgi:hypothetical protein